MLATMQDIKYQEFLYVSTTRINVPKIIKITGTNFRTFGVVGDFSFVPNSHFDKYISLEPMSHVFTMTNVFREDVVTNGDDRDNMLKNAPECKDGSYKVPKTVE